MIPTFSQSKNHKKTIILFDEAHTPTYTTSTRNPSYDGTGTKGNGGYSIFAETIKNEFDAEIRTLDATIKYSEYRRINEGLHWVSKGGEITNASLKDIDLLVIPASIGNYTSSELSEIVRFVKNGGSLLLIGEGPSSATRTGTYAFGAELILEKFGVEVGGTLRDYDNGMQFTADRVNVSDPEYLIFNSTLMGKHQITDGLSRVEFFRGWHLLFPPYEATTLLYSSPSAMVPNAPVALAIPTCRMTGDGRVVMVGDGGMFKDYMVGEVGHGGDEDWDGTVDFNDAENRIFAMNIIRWLTHYYDFNIYFTGIDTPETSEKTIGPNQTVEYPIKIKNIGHDVNNDTIDFKIDGVPAGWKFDLKRGSENISSITMTVGEEVNLTLGITTPDDMINTTATIVITGTSRNDANATHNITAITNLYTIYNITVAPSEEQITVLPGDTARYFLSITNNGTIIDEFRVKIENESGAYAIIEGGLTDLSLLPGQTTSIKLLVVPQIYTPPTKMYTTVKIESKRNFGNISVPLTMIVDIHHSIDVGYYVHPYTKNDASILLTVILTNRGNIRESAELNMSTDRSTENLSVQNIIEVGSSINIPFAVIQPPAGEANNVYLNVSYADKKSTPIIPVSSAKVGAILKTYNTTFYAAKGTSLKIPVLIKNVGNLKDVFILSTSGKFKNWSIENEDSNIISLDPISSRIIYVDVCIPSDADITTSTTWINITSQLNPEINASQTINVVVKSILELSNLRIDRKTIKNGDSIQIFADVKNWKNEKLNVTISFMVDGKVMENKYLSNFSNSTQLQFCWIAEEGKHKIELKSAVGNVAQTDANIRGDIDVERGPILSNQTLLFLVVMIVVSAGTWIAVKRWEK